MNVAEKLIAEQILKAFQNNVSCVVHATGKEIVRKFLFSQGAFIGAFSSQVEEYPGYFLYQTKKLDTKGFETYKEVCSHPNVRQWDVLQQQLQMSPTELQASKVNYANFVLEKSFQDSLNHIETQKKIFPANIPVICSKEEFIFSLSKLLSLESIFEIIPALNNEEVSLTLQKIISTDGFDPDAIGIINLLKQYKEYKDVLNNSFLKPNEISKMLFSLAQLGVLIIEDKAGFQKKEFLKSLSLVDLDHRNKIQLHHDRSNSSTLYEILQIDSNATPEQIKKAFEGLKMLFQNADHLFATFEENLAQVMLSVVTQAFSVLSHKEKRLEYNQYLNLGKHLQYFQTSSILSDEKAYKQFIFLVENQKFIEAVELGVQYTAQRPQMIGFGIALIELIVTQSFVQESKYQKHCLELIKFYIQSHPDRYEPYFLLGKLSLLLNQPVNAQKAFEKALEKRPDIPSLRGFMMDQLKDKGSETVINAISKKSSQLNFYQILAIDPHASNEEIHQAYRFCCKHFHPDRFYQHADPNFKKTASNLFKEIVRAYQTLKNLQSRQLYDVSIFSQQTGELDAVLAPPKHFKAREHFSQGCKRVLDKDFSGALLHFEFALQIEPENPLILRKIEETKALLNVH